MISARVVARLMESVQELRRRRRRPSSKKQHATKSAMIAEPQITITENSSTSNCANLRAPTAVTRPPLSLGYALCKQWAWHAITFRCQTHPHEVNMEFIDERGDTALHWVVFGNPPLDVVDALLEACPALASTPNFCGMLPIHVAASYRACGDVVRSLVQAYPEGAGIPAGVKAYCPLHLMCDYGSSLDSLRAVLESKSGVASLRAVDRVFERTPLQVLNLRKNMNEYHRMVSELRNIRRRQDALREAMTIEGTHDQTALKALEDKVEPYREYEFWKIASLLVLTEYTNSVTDEDEDKQRFVLNACTTLWEQCPTSLVELALLLHPEQLLQGDGQGRLPLHNAAWRQDSTVLLDLLRACQEVTKIQDAGGFLPVQLAIQSGRRWEDGIREMIVANPMSIEAMEIDDRLYPRIWYKLQQQSADALFESIRAKPSLMAKVPQ